MANDHNTLRIAAVGDTHCGKNSRGQFQPLFAQINEKADVLLLCGDITDYGLPEEAQIITKELTTALKIPTIGVLGNHDVQSRQQETVKQIFVDAGVTMLDGEAVEIRGVGFAGVKGFAGGFDNRALQPWGEEIIKSFVHEAVEETVKLESALAKLRTPQKIVLMHYSPIRSTVEGEPSEIVPFLGSSRLEEPLVRYQATAIFHGHAHHGAFEGKTHGGAPVYNVAMPLLKKIYPDRPPFFIFELPVLAGAAA